MAIARFPQVVLDCPDPTALATFYGALLDWQVKPGDGWAEVRAEYGDSMGFQQVDGYNPPDWPSQTAPSSSTARSASSRSSTVTSMCICCGAVKHAHQPGTTFRVFLDPAGHPFCLCVS